MRETRPRDGDLLESADVARILGVKPATIRYWARIGKIAPYLVLPRGGRLYRRRDILDLAAALDRG